MPAFVTRVPFVGREAELQTVREAIDAASAGDGSVALIVGEPGIGKTALCEQAAAYAVERDGQVLVGRCYEEGSLSLPYLPFIEALRTYVLGRGREPLRRELGAHAPDVARIVPELCDILDIVPSPATDPDADRYRLLQSVTAFLRELAAARPLLLVLEDLHDADRGTLDLLLHVARNLRGARLLLLGTYRDVEVDRAHPLSGSLAELRRAAPVRRVRLSGLSVEQSRELVAAVAGQVVQQSVATAVQQQTEGNPLFVQEVARYLSEEGLLAGGTLPSALRIPEGLRDVIGKRLTRLTEDCNRLLGVAAVIGRDFDLVTLRAVVGMAEEVADAALGEATQAAVLEEDERPGAVRYRFAHAFFRQTLYEELSAPRRLRLHQQIARALETQHAARLAEHAAELAEHFSHSTDGADLAKAVQYGELAAQRAVSVYAYREAARLLEQALDVQDVVDPDDRARRCDLLLAHGNVVLAAGEPMRAVEELAPEAFALAETLHDAHRASSACQLALGGLNRYGAGTVTGSLQYRQWAERADRYAAPGTIHRVHADIVLASTYERTRREREAWPLYVRALELARTIDHPETLFFAASGLLWSPRAPQYRAEMRRVADEFAARPRDGVTVRTLSLLANVGAVYLDWGERERAEEMWRQVDELAVRARDANTVLVTLATPIVLARLDGQLGTAIALGERLKARADELGMPVWGRQNAFVATWRARVYLGRADEVLAALPEARRTAGLPEDIDVPNALRACCLAHTGQFDAARNELTRYLDYWGVGRDETDISTYMLSSLLETAVLVEDHESANVLSHQLAGMSDSAMAMWAWGGTCVARHLGAAAALLGELERARAYYQQALEAAGKIRFRPEVALTGLQFTDLLLDGDSGERAEALRNLEAAIAEFEDMHMAPALERARQLRERAAGRAPPPTAEGIVEGVKRPTERRLLTLLFTDLVGSTERAAALGDRRWVELKARHHALVRRELTRFGGHEVDTAGDGFFATFETPERAIRCACFIRDAMQALEIEVRAGLHFGEVEVAEREVSGIAVHTGARVMALATGGEVLVSQMVRDLVAGAGIRFVERGVHRFKGVPGEWPLFAVAALEE